MRSLGRNGLVRGRRPRTTIPNPGDARAPDLLDRDFTAPAPNRRITDFTCVRTYQSFTYVAFIVDCFSQKIVSWHASIKRDVELVDVPLRMALWRRTHEGNPVGRDELIHHSDAGSQYTSVRFAEHLSIEGIRPSIGSVGDAYDNALMETINGWPGGGRTSSRPAELGSPRPTTPIPAPPSSAARPGTATRSTSPKPATPRRPGQPHLITHVVTTDATVGDPVVIDTIHDQLDANGLLPGEHLMDAGYISAELLLTAPSQRGVRVIGPVRPMTRRTVQATGYDKASFSIDWDARRATCPAGAHSRYWTDGLDNNQRSAIRIRFATETCAPCPSRGQGTDSTHYGRQLTVRPQDQDVVLERVRAEQTTEERKAVYAIRSGVEGTSHQAVTAAGTRRTRYAGLRKTALAHILTATAANLLRLDAWWPGQPLAPTRTSHLAALDLAA